MCYDAIGKENTCSGLEVVDVSRETARFNPDDLVAFYTAGNTVKETARHFRVGTLKVTPILQAAGVFQPRWREVPTAEIVAAYVAGASEKALAEHYGVARGVIRRRLADAGVQPRGRSEAMYARMAQTSPEERMRLSHAAHDAVRGRVYTEDEKAVRAKTAQNKRLNMSPAEFVLREMLGRRGVVGIVPTMAIGPYNCDAAIDPVAVEIFGGHWHFSGRHLARSSERIRYLMDRGWHVLMIVLTQTHPLSDTTADYVAAYVQEARRNPTARREYRVIWGTGETLAAGSADDKEISIVPAFTSGRNALGQYVRVPRNATGV